MSNREIEPEGKGVVEMTTEKQIAANALKAEVDWAADQ
jgi:hypothetical protein